MKKRISGWGIMQPEKVIWGRKVCRYINKMGCPKSHEGRSPIVDLKTGCRLLGIKEGKKTFGSELKRIVCRLDISSLAFYREKIDVS